MNDTIKAIADTINTPCPKQCDHGAAVYGCACAECTHTAERIYTAHVKPLEDALATAQAMCRTAHDVARAAWGGEIPSPLPGHRHSTEEEMLAEAERCNCPWCGGSGHIDDCDEADRLVKAKLAKAEADKAALVEALDWCTSELEPYIGCTHNLPQCVSDEFEKCLAMLARMKESPCPKN